MKDRICKSINLIWPLLLGEKNHYNKFLSEDALKSKRINEKDVDRAIKMYELQRDRIKTIESKSIVFIGFFASIVAIIGIAIREIIQLKDKSISDYILMILAGILMAYTSMIILYAIRALERTSYNSLDENDILESGQRQKFISIINKVKRNYDAINDKVDYMSMAQEFAKKIIILIIIIALIIIIFGIIQSTKLVSLIYEYYIYESEISSWLK